MLERLCDIILQLNQLSCLYSDIIYHSRWYMSVRKIIFLFLVMSPYMITFKFLFEINSFSLFFTPYIVHISLTSFIFNSLFCYYLIAMSFETLCINVRCLRITWENTREKLYLFIDIFYKIIRNLENMYTLLTGHSLIIMYICVLFFKFCPHDLTKHWIAAETLNLWISIFFLFLDSRLNYNFSSIY